MIYEIGKKFVYAYFEKLTKKRIFLGLDVGKTCSKIKLALADIFSF